MNKKLGAIALLGASAVVLAGCSTGSTATDGGTPEPAELRVWLVGTDTPQDARDYLVKTFEDENPGSTLTIEEQQWTGLVDKLTTSLSSSDSPDVVEMGNTQAAAFTSSGALLDLSDIEDARTGIAAGFVNAGRLWRGAYGTAGEVGHICVDPRGPLCKCGQRGCIEAFSGGGALAERWGRPGALPVRDVFDGADAGDPVALALRDGFAFGVAAAVRVIVLSTDVESVVLGGRQRPRRPYAEPCGDRTRGTRGGIPVPTLAAPGRPGRTAPAGFARGGARCGAPRRRHPRTGDRSSWLKSSSSRLRRPPASWSPTRS